MIALFCLRELALGNELESYKFAVLLNETEFEIMRERYEKFSHLGQKMCASLEKGRIESIKTRQEKSRKQKKQWRELAINSWQEHPGWTVNDMAKWIKESTDTSATEKTIYQELKGIKTSMFPKK